TSMPPTWRRASRPNTGFVGSPRRIPGACSIATPTSSAPGIRMRRRAPSSTTAAAPRGPSRRARRRCRGAKITYSTPAPSSPTAKGRMAKRIARPSAKISHPACSARFTGTRLSRGTVRGRRFPSGGLLHGDPEDDGTERHRVALPKRLRQQGAQQLHRLLPRLALPFRAVGVDHIEAAANQHAAPAEQGFHLVHLEDHRPPPVRRLAERFVLRPVRRAPVDPAVGEDVVDRLDLDPVLPCVAD